MLVAAVFICAIEEQGAVIRFLMGWKCTRCWNIENDVSAMWEQHGVTTGRLWVDWKFRNGHTSVRQEERAGPATGE